MAIPNLLCLRIQKQTLSTYPCHRHRHTYLDHTSDRFQFRFTIENLSWGLCIHIFVGELTTWSNRMKGKKSRILTACMQILLSSLAGSEPCPRIRDWGCGLYRLHIRERLMQCDLNLISQVAHMPPHIGATKSQISFHPKYTQQSTLFYSRIYVL